MWESAEDLKRLQEVLDRSIAEARSPMLHHIFRPDRAVTAKQIGIESLPFAGTFSVDGQVQGTVPRTRPKGTVRPV